MKAIVQTQYGSPDVLQLQEVAKPEPAANEVRVKVHTVSVTPSDSAFRKGDPFLVRLMYGLKKPRQAIGGVEFSGVIDAIGPEVTTFKVGDAIFGMSPDKFGAYAEYICLGADKPIAHKSPQMTFEESTGIIDGAATAQTFLHNVANVQPGQKVLINGASGAVGAYAVQIAKHLGAEVTGVCSSSNIDMVRSLGADHVIDYTQDDFAQNHNAYDVIFDAVGKRSFGECKKALTQNGIYMTTVPSPSLIVGLLSSMLGSKKAKFTTAGLKQSRATLDNLTHMYEAGAFKAIIDRCYALEDVPEAHRYVDTERKRGNIVIQVAN